MHARLDFEISHGGCAAQYWQRTTLPPAGILRGVTQESHRLRGYTEHRTALSCEYLKLTTLNQMLWSIRKCENCEPNAWQVDELVIEWDAMNYLCPILQPSYRSQTTT